MPKIVSLTLNFNQDLVKELKKTEVFDDFRILSKSLDARGAPRGRVPTYHYKVELKAKSESFVNERAEAFKVSSFAKRPVIIGAGPAGLFCALRFASAGVAVTVIERGAAANKRMLDISKYWRKGVLNTESNVCYGEGGAGLFSDGKLITRIKSDLVQEVMHTFVDYGAPEEVAYLSNPHLGSNKIRKIITEITNDLKSRDTDVRVDTRVDEILFENNKVVGVLLDNGETIETDHVILATGHSARQMYYKLYESKVAMGSKDFALGVRVEHPRRLIDEIQHGKFAKELETARYKLTHYNRTSERGTYSFCMCPGGYVLSSGTEADGIVVNGMSNFARNSPWSNSALVVTVKAGRDYEERNALSGLAFQESIEKMAYQMSVEHATGRELPAMTVTEFMQGSLNSKVLPKTSSPSKIFKANLLDILPPFVVEHLRAGLKNYDRKMPGFISDEAVLIAPETRTSAPITILRDKTTFESISHSGLYPCGEGAGHAGGITSAAVDGMKVADSILKP